MNDMKKTTKRFTHILKKATTILAVFVVFLSTYAMTLPALTLDEETTETSAGIVLDEESNDEAVVYDDTDDEAEVADYGYDPFLVEEEKENTINNNAIDEDTDEISLEETSDELKENVLSFYDDSNDVIVSVQAPLGAFEEGTIMIVTPVKEEEVIDTVNSTLENDESNNRATKIQAVDISFYCNDEEVEPLLPIKVSLTSKLIKESNKDPKIIHIDDKGEGEIIEQSSDVESKEDEVIFEAESFSTYVLVITTDYITDEGDTYKITVTYDEEAGIPEGAWLEVREIVQEEERGDAATEYEEYLYKSQEALGSNTLILSYARFFDITIYDGEGNKIQPVEGSSVSVKIELYDKEQSAEYQVLHFAKESEVLEISNTEDAVFFETTGFSVYAIVETETVSENSGYLKISDLDQLSAIGSNGVYISNPLGYYFTNEQYVVSGTRTGILKTKPKIYSPDDSDKAALYYFESVGSNQFEIYCMQGDEKKYLKQTDNSLSLVDETQAQAFTISVMSSDEKTFRIQGNENYCVNMQSGESGNGFAAYANNINDGNNKLRFEYYVAPSKDLYGLNGKTYGIVYRNGEIKAAGLVAETNGTKLKAVDTLIRPDVLDKDGILLVAENSEISDWTFTSIDSNRYYLSTTINEETKYLKISGNSLTLTNSEAEASIITVTQGTGNNEGKWHFTAEGRCVRYGGSVNTGFEASTNGTSDLAWFDLVERSILEDEDFVLYDAKKVSVSDTDNVYDKQQVVIYTRIWNDKTKKYEFYVVDHDGTLVLCSDVGDGIEWIGAKINTALWEFTEYTNSDGTPNYYYELKNVQYGNYIAPQQSGSQIMSDSTIGINMNGRRYGENYSTIIAWDDINYSYSGLKTENGRIVSCPVWEAEDFYFAIISPKEETEDKLTTVYTIDSDAFGIKMTVVDYNNAIKNKDGVDAGNTTGRDSGQTAVLGYDTDTAGLLSTDLKENGYPATDISKTGTAASHSLAELFDINAEDSKVTTSSEANHLFIESIYRESGYFEYDSTQNFASFNSETGNFVVYDQLGATSDYNTETGKHGQFFPYHDLDADKKSPLVNTTNVLAQELPGTDPRKGETLYSVGERLEVDYFFGMQLEASFTQTANGLDAWGHDIIFEFSGDDDFWLYVDGELVLDLGGVHKAMTGSVNFRTGEIKTSNRGNTTLYEVFKKNFKNRGMTDAQVNEELSKRFEKKGDNWVFKDYSNHDMKIFYMERGAGASNLHMRFNLAAVKPGTFLLSKKLSGTEETDNSLIEFPYQIYYLTKQDGEHSAWHLLEEKTGNEYNVLYEGTSSHVRYEESFTPAGGTDAYSNVFFLKPGQTASVTLPENVTKYYVVECGVNPDVYDKVTANGSELTGTQTNNMVGETARKDYPIAAATLADRSKVEYDNHVAKGAMRTLLIAKRLYDQTGNNLIPYADDPTEFSFRLYLGNENVNIDDVPLANMYDYYVKDISDNYCKWNAEEQKFESLDVTDFAQLSDEQKLLATFQTSMNGSISKIPTDHTIEVRNLIIGTSYKVEERDNEIPKGYTRRISDGYTRVDSDPDDKQANPYSGIMQKDETPKIEVRNQIGWGLSVEKVWTDKDFMSQHDDIFFAVYLDDEPIQNTIRRLSSGETEVYYFFEELADGKQFKDYEIWEVVLEPNEGTEIVVNDDGVVQGNNFTITKIAEGDTLTVGGTPVGGQHSDEIEYKVNYTVGEVTGHNENVRVDTVTNSRPGILIYKTDWEGNSLANATFTLKVVTSEGKSDVAASSYTSSEDGLVTIAYLNSGTYELDETESPKGYTAIDQPLTIAIRENDGDYSVVLGGPDQSEYILETEGIGDMTAKITVKNRKTSFDVLKVSSEGEKPLKGVHFALFRQVTDVDGNPRKDYLPMKGYSDLVTGDDGILPSVNISLPRGTYYLTETATIEGYELLKEDICFSIQKDGKVTMESSGSANLTSVFDKNRGTVSYRITVINGEVTPISFMKVDISDTEKKLSGAEFELYDSSYTDETIEDDPLPLAVLVSDTDGMLKDDSGNSRLNLVKGTYYLVETKAPAGYNLKDGPVKIVVTETGVTYAEDTAISSGNDGVRYDEETGIYTLLITNTAGIELPMTGGIGTTIFRMAGLTLILTAGIVLIFKKRH
ncbi:MAG: LPXTG cell wall anchor domain-containing protein [Erysipelotrichaceae bacterium]|nr:LPXTG cell wall anchor domain-containing protein [Erysipelotrichaceae bacterium]